MGVRVTGCVKTRLNNNKTRHVRLGGLGGAFRGNSQPEMLLPPSPQATGRGLLHEGATRTSSQPREAGREEPDTGRAPSSQGLLDARSGPWGDIASGRATSEVDPGGRRGEAKGGDSGDKRTGSWRSTAGPEHLVGSTQPSQPLKCAPPDRRKRPGLYRCFQRTEEGSCQCRDAQSQPGGH